MNVLKLTPEEASRMGRLIQIGDPDEKLPTGETVGEYRRKLKEAEYDREKVEKARQAEAEALRASAAPSHDSVVVSVSEEGRLLASPVTTPESANGQSSSAEQAISESEGRGESDALPKGFPYRADLIGAGLDTLTKVDAASDEQLLALEHVGDVAVSRIRAARAAASNL
jgi:hypothetical protein